MLSAVKVLEGPRNRGHKGNLDRMCFPFLIAEVDLRDVMTDEVCKSLIEYQDDAVPHYMKESQPDGKRLLYPHSEMDDNTSETLKNIRLRAVKALNLPGKYNNGVSALTCTNPGAKNQSWHQDIAYHIFTEKNKKDHGLSAMIAVNESRFIEFRIHKERPPKRLEVRPRHALVFRSSLCHRGCGSALCDEFKLAIHFYLDPNNEPNLGAKTFGCAVQLKKLYVSQLHSFQHFNNRTDGKCKPTLEHGKGDNELTGVSLKQMKCQLCTKIMDLGETSVESGTSPCFSSLVHLKISVP